MDAIAAELKEKQNASAPGICVYSRPFVVSPLGVVTVFSPAKLNLFLAVTGRRTDGFHDLISVAAPLEFGDELRAEDRGRRTEDRNPFTLECDAPGVPLDESNLVLKAARLFVRETGWKGGANFTLKKRIPVGAGLGGGSSNAVAALRALDRLAGTGLPEEKLAEMATALGSDCPLFLHDAPVVMRGRGEKIEALPPAARARLSGRCVLVFKPSFGIPTAWAYQRMIMRGGDYLEAREAEGRLSGWLAGAGLAEEFLFNNMEPAAFEKYVGLPVLLEILRKDFGLEPRMSGSGSACYALLKDADEAEPVIARIRECWGQGAFAVATKLV